MAEEQAIKDLITSFIGTLKTRDKALMQSQLLPGFSATLVRNGTILQLDQKAFLERLPWEAKEEIEEILTSIDVKVYKDIAVVWTPFYTTRDGKMTTRGTNIITTLKVNKEGKGAGDGWGTWMVSGVFDTSVSCSESDIAPSSVEGKSKGWPHV